MAKLRIEDHPTAKAALAKPKDQAQKLAVLDSDWLKKIALECGADDAGLVEMSRPALANEKNRSTQQTPLDADLVVLRREG